MLQTQFLQPRQPGCSYMSSHQNEVELEELDMAAHLGDFEFSSALAAADDNFDISMESPNFSNMFLEGLPFENMAMAALHDDTSAVSPFQDYAWSLVELADMSKVELLISDVEHFCGWTGENWGGIALQNPLLNEEESMVTSTKSGDVSFGETESQLSRIVAKEGAEFDNEISIHHLLKAYGEAVGMGSIELAEVILQRLRQKVRPVGATMERLGHYLFQEAEEQTDYLNKESRKNYGKAFQAFYETCPYGRFAHFAANMAILNAVPEDAQTIHILDFKIGEGVQWPPLLEALGRDRMVRLTSIAWRDEIKNPHPQFKGTKKRLCNYGKCQGLMLKVDEMDLEYLLQEKKRMKKIGGGKEWMAFNCMVGLPHMSRDKNKENAWEFMRVAKEIISISNTGSSKARNRGIITLGCGDEAQLRDEDGGGFGSFFDGCLLHYRALFESMESHFPPHLSLARTAMECLFVGPSVSFSACHSRWKERQKAYQMNLGESLGGWRISQESLLEAREMVRGQSLYTVKIEGERENEMVLEWRRTPLVRMSVWR